LVVSVVSVEVVGEFISGYSSDCCFYTCLLREWSFDRHRMMGGRFGSVGSVSRGGREFISGYSSNRCFYTCLLREWSFDHHRMVGGRFGSVGSVSRGGRGVHQRL
jgi:hypothetical protein